LVDVVVVCHGIIWNIALNNERGAGGGQVGVDAVAGVVC
jgi:hypothetical protein